MNDYPSGKRTLSNYSGWALIGLSLIGIASSFYKEMPLIPTLIIIVLPYTIAFLSSVALLLGYKWAKAPILMISAFGMLLNIKETIEGPNQKDIFEIILFATIIFLIVLDSASKDASE